MSRQDSVNSRAESRLSNVAKSVALPIVLALAIGWLPVLATGAAAATIHAIFVIDTNDKNIGRMVALDLGLMDREVNRIGAMTGLNTRKTFIKGNNFTLNKVGAAVQGLAAGPDDVILFYYSGHGFRTKQKTYKWPYFWFHTNEPLDYAWVIQTLTAKGARLTLMLTDACNNVVNASIRETDQYRAKAMVNADAYKKLFLGHKGFIAATSSIPGETSTATSDGSLFTLSFLKALHEEGAKSNPSWVDLMDRGAGQKLYLNGKYKHTPFYEMNVALAATGGTAPPVNPPMPPAPTVQPPAPQPPQMACNIPNGAGAPSGTFGNFPYWTNKFFKGLHYAKVHAQTPPLCHSACLKDKNCVSWVWDRETKKCVFKHYCPKNSFGPVYGTISGYSGRKPMCAMGPGCGEEAAAAAPAPAPAPQPAQPPAQQPDPFGGGIQSWGQPGGSAPATPQAPAPAQGGGWQSIN